MTFFMIGGIVCVITACVLILVYLLAHKMGEQSTASKIICWLGMIFGVAGASLMTIEYSFPHISHPEWYESSTTESEPQFTDYVTVCVSVQFQIDHEECTILTIDTADKVTYYITDIFYRPDYQNNIYETKYISAVNADNELVIKEVTL